MRRIFQAECVDEFVAQPIGPGHDDVGNGLFYSLDTDPRTIGRCRVHNKVHARERGVGYLHARVNGCSAKCVLQNRFDLAPNQCRVFFARHVDEAGEETPKRIPTQKELYSLAVLQVENAHRGSCQVLYGTLKKLLAREGVDDMQQRFAAMPGRIDVRAFDVPGMFAAIRVTVAPWELLEQFLAAFDSVCEALSLERDSDQPSASAES